MYDIESNESETMIDQETFSISNYNKPLNFDNISLTNDKSEFNPYPINITPDSKYLVSGSYNNQLYIKSVSKDNLEIYIDFTNILMQSISYITCIDSIVDKGDDYNFVFGSFDSYVYIYNMKDNQSKMFDNSSPVLSIKISTDNNYIVTGSLDGITRVYDKKSYKLIRKYYKKNPHYKRYETYNEIDLYNSVNSVDMTYCSKYIVTGHDDGTAKLWSIQTSDIVYTYHGHLDAVLAVYISSDGYYLLTGSRDGSAILWDLMGGYSYMSYPGQYAPVNSVSINNSNQLVLIGTGSTAKLYDLHTGELYKIYSGYHGVVRSVVFHQTNFIYNGNYNESERVAVEDELNKLIHDNLNIETSQAELNEILFGNLNIKAESVYQIE